MLKINVLKKALIDYRQNVLSSEVADMAIKRMSDEIDIDTALDTLYSYSNIDRILMAIDRGNECMKGHCYKCSGETVTVAEYNELYEILSDIIR